jgi:integrase
MPWGSGSISGPGSDGRYEVRVSLGSVDGKRRRVNARADSMSEARAKLAELQARYGKTRGMGATPKLADYVQGWTTRRARSLEAKTIRNYRYGLALLDPALGHVRLDALTHEQIATAIDGLRRDGKGEPACRVAYDALRAALNWAVKRDRILTASPIASVDRPKETRSIDFLTREEAKKFLEAVADDRYRAVFHLAISTGMRLGEIAGLHWREVDLENGTLLISRALKESRDFGKPKSKTSQRTIDMSPSIVAELREHKHRWRRLARTTDLVFATNAGTPLRASNFERRSFFPALERAGIRRVRFHDLRHTCATLLLGAGVNPKVVQELLGHSSVRVTLDMYGHTSPGMGKAAAAQMGEMLGTYRSAKPKARKASRQKRSATD